MRCVLVLAGCCLSLALVPAASAADPGDRAGADFFEKAIRPGLVQTRMQDELSASPYIQRRRTGAGPALVPPERAAESDPVEVSVAQELPRALDAA